MDLDRLDPIIAKLREAANAIETDLPDLGLTINQAKYSITRITIMVLADQLDVEAKRIRDRVEIAKRRRQRLAAGRKFAPRPFPRRKSGSSGKRRLVVSGGLPGLGKRRR